MSTVGWLPAPAEELFGPEATAEESYEVLTVDVPPASWLTALEAARDRLSCTYFDWLSAVDEPGTGFRVAAHVVSLSPVRRLLVRTTVPHEAPTLPSAVGVYAGAAWHERETHEMFGVGFEGHPALDHLLLPETFEGHPLRKDFVLAARVAKAWPGAKEPGESDHGGPKRRQMLPPGVPDPNEWGPQKGQLPPAPTRPARGAGRTAAGERPARRTRSAGEGSASQTAAAAAGAATGASRRSRSAAEGSVSQAAAAGEGAGAGASRRSRSAAEGSASRRPAAEPGGEAAAGPRRARTAAEGSASQRPAAESGAAEAAPSEDSSSQTAAVPSAEGRNPRPASRSSDAPWHHARPAFDEPGDEKAPSPVAEPVDQRDGEPDIEPDAERDAEPTRARERAPKPPADADTGPDADADADADTGADADTDADTGSETDADAGSGKHDLANPEDPAADPQNTAHPEDPAGGPQ
ncbi:NADH-quinone oxidoreductase subunit C [Streptomyces sediminimaris]|uniref:NADH-quinone oxidoreductase subunit C n=1 Tax=Streptomyces sediminimaris TaxID=3383721 RepID=UPI00399AE64E